jgi:hypothetical protein
VPGDFAKLLFGMLGGTVEIANWANARPWNGNRRIRLVKEATCFEIQNRNNIDLLLFLTLEVSSTLSLYPKGPHGDVEKAC